MRPLRSLCLVLLASLLFLGASAAPGTGMTAARGRATVLGDILTGCPPGFRCQEVEVACPGVEAPARAALAESFPTLEQPRGVVMFFSGAQGTTWWNSGTGVAADFLSRLRDADGFVVVQIRWIDPWLDASPGEEAGPARLACRPATTIQLIYDTVYLPLGISPLPGQCGFCITGNSGGASQVSYALSFYGLDTILNAVIPTSGPPHAALAKGCLPGFPQYTYDPTEIGYIDSSYGFLPGGPPGPCAHHNPAWTARWQADSVESGGDDYSYPNTRVEFVIGAIDNTDAPAHATDFRDKLLEDPSNNVTWTVVPTMGHTIQEYPAGLAALEAALLKTL